MTYILAFIYWYMAAIHLAALLHPKVPTHGFLRTLAIGSLGFIHIMVASTIPVNMHVSALLGILLAALYTVHKTTGENLND
jgi:uncharacterized membrane protein YfhO